VRARDPVADLFVARAVHPDSVIGS